MQRVDAADWRAAVGAQIAAGHRFAGAWASERAGIVSWHALLVRRAQRRVLVCSARERCVDTIVDLAESAGWDEREAHDLYGLRFEGHSPMRALVAHPADRGRWTTPVTGAGVHQVAVGPIHAGVIESGHFRMHVVGERILALDLRLFYKHRGLERAAEGDTADGARIYVARACAACAVANATAYAHAAEDALGLQPDRDLRIARTVALELERLYNHLHDLGALCSGVGFAAGAMAFAALKERAQRVNAALTGHRFLFGSVAPRTGALVADAGAVDSAAAQLRELRTDSAAAWRELEFAGSLQARLGGVGVLAREDALRLGAVGPAARASGVHADVRADSPRLWYPGFGAAVAPSPAGDVAARLALRAAELETTYDILAELLVGALAAGSTVALRSPQALGAGRVESPRGETTCALTFAAGRIARLHLRTGSYANWPALAHAATGNLLPDFPLINKSFELCYACVDR
ncbi:MAG: NADH-quinone oxidoreductase subunit C [Thermoleophilia bacterium]